MNARPSTVAVIGAGISGCMCGHLLEEQGFAVTVFDKARGPGGRTATRRTDSFSVDHGAQYFTTRDPGFNRIVQRWLETGVVERWPEPLAVLGGGTVRLLSGGERYVGVPGMSALTRDLLQHCDCHYGAGVTVIHRRADRWHLTLSDRSEAGPFDVLVVATPPAQAAGLIGNVSPLGEQAGEVEMVSCWATVLALPAPLEVRFSGAFVEHGDLSWIARDSSKPRRHAERDVWVLHATAEWSQANVDAPREFARQSLWRSLEAAVGIEVDNAEHILTHRWLYARPERTDGRGSLFDPAARIGLCGDWLTDGRVEAAALSGVNLAERILSGVGS